MSRIEFVDRFGCAEQETGRGEQSLILWAPGWVLEHPEVEVST